MDKILLIVAVFISQCLPLYAQENKSFLIQAKVKQGSILIGGNLDAAIYKTTKELNQPIAPEEGTNIVANLNFKSGYFIGHDFAVGLALALNHDSYSVTIDNEKEKFRRTFLLGGPFTRYYLDNGFFGELALKGGLLNFSSGDKTNLFEGSIGIGYAFFINEKISFEPLLSFRYNREWDSSGANVTLGPLLGFGIQAYLLRRTSHIIKEAL